jgi:hypothetical protein
MVNSPSGFFSSLYDLSFHSFITPKIIRVVYVIALIISGIWALLFLLSAFAPTLFGQGPSAESILLHVIGAPILFVVWSIGARMSLELIMAVFNIAENTEAMKNRQPNQLGRSE